MIFEVCYYNGGDVYKNTSKRGGGVITDTSGKIYSNDPNSGQYITTVGVKSGVVDKMYYIVDPCATVYSGVKSEYNHILEEVNFPRKDLATFLSLDSDDVLCDIYFSTECYEDLIEIADKYNINPPLSKELISDFNDNKENWVYNWDVPMKYKKKKPMSDIQKETPELLRRFFAMAVKYDESRNPIFMKMYKYRGF